MKNSRSFLCMLVAVIALLLIGCAGPDVGPVGDGGQSLSASDSSGILAQGVTAHPCQSVTVALDPGHNPTSVQGYDPVTGAAQIDYPNGAEDADDFAVAEIVKASLDGAGYRTVLLKKSTGESVTYRERVRRAEKAGAALGVSIHTSPGVNQVFPQRVGLYREGVGENGNRRRVVFTEDATAKLSQRYSKAIANGRSLEQGIPVAVTDNNFGGRAPLWEGNIPIISLISTRVPWVYNEFSMEGAGGSIGLSEHARRVYAEGLIRGIRGALPIGDDSCSK